MIDRGGVLRGGTRRRRRRRSRAPLLALVAFSVAAAALLWLMAPKVSSPSIAHRTAKAPARAGNEAAAEQSVVAPPTYGAHMAPPSERINFKPKAQLWSGLLFDVRTGTVLWERHPDRTLAIASLTKMMTALVVVEHAKPNDRVLITPAATHYSGSGVGLLPQGKRVPLLPLLYGLLLPSGNDAAIALAQHVARNQARFVRMMNARARELGLRCTHFSSPSGIVDQGNRSCAAELAVLAHLVVEQPRLGRIVASRSAILPFPIKGGKLYLYNNNPLLLMRYPGADGVKTGFTDAAGHCLVVTARRGRTWLGVVLLHSADTIDQAQALLNAGFAKLRGRA